MGGRPRKPCRMARIRYKLKRDRAGHAGGSAALNISKGYYVRKRVLLVTLLLLISACSNRVGHRLDNRNLQHIHAGQTTKAQLIALFGQPDSETPYPDGQRLLKWTYSEARTLNTTEGQTLIVQMKNDKVLNYALSKS